MSDLEDTVEYFVQGSTFGGELRPAAHMKGTLCAQCAVQLYVNRFPDVVHISMEISLPIKTEGRE